jgi:GNAT superfamily N-acetyltransferase
VVEVWLGARPDGIAEDEHRAFSRRRLAGLRELFAPGGRGAWYVALDGERVVGSCGIVVTGRRARYQAVDTVPSHRRRGICSRLLIDAAEHASTRHPVGSFVIAADPAYHALGIYESLGFRARERVGGVVRRPGAV